MSHVIIDQLTRRGFEIVLDATTGRMQVCGDTQPDRETRALIEELRKHRDEVRQAIDTDPEHSKYADRMLESAEWTPVFKAWILRYYDEHPDHDRCWLKEHHHKLYQQIVAQENKIDALGTVRFADLMTELRAWRKLMLQAEFATAKDVRRLFGGEIMTAGEFEEQRCGAQDGPETGADGSTSGRPSLESDPIVFEDGEEF